MKRLKVLYLSTFMLLYPNIKADWNLDHPMVVGFVANLAFENPFNANLLCLAHWIVKNKSVFDQQTAAQELISYILGSALGRCLRPEIKLWWHSTRTRPTDTGKNK